MFVSNTLCTILPASCYIQKSDIKRCNLLTWICLMGIMQVWVSPFCLKGFLMFHNFQYFSTGEWSAVIAKRNDTCSVSNKSEEEQEKAEWHVAVIGVHMHGLKSNRMNHATRSFWQIDLATQANTYLASHNLHSSLKND